MPGGLINLLNFLKSVGLQSRDMIHRSFSDSALYSLYQMSSCNNDIMMHPYSNGNEGSWSTSPLIRWNSYPCTPQSLSSSSFYSDDGGYYDDDDDDDGGYYGDDEEEVDEMDGDEDEDDFGSLSLLSYGTSSVSPDSNLEREWQEFSARWDMEAELRKKKEEKLNEEELKEDPLFSRNKCSYEPTLDEEQFPETEDSKEKEKEKEKGKGKGKGGLTLGD